MTAIIIRSVSFDMGQDRVRFTVLTDITDSNDNRRQQLHNTVNIECNRDEFITLGEHCFELMHDKNFLFLENVDLQHPMSHAIIDVGGEITLTREWMDIHSYDIYMNCIFNDN